MDERLEELKQQHTIAEIEKLQLRRRGLEMEIVALDETIEALVVSGNLKDWWNTRKSESRTKGLAELNRQQDEITQAVDNYLPPPRDECARL